MEEAIRKVKKCFKDAILTVAAIIKYRLKFNVVFKIKYY